MVVLTACYVRITDISHIFFFLSKKTQSLPCVAVHPSMDDTEHCSPLDIQGLFRHLVAHGGLK